MVSPGVTRGAGEDVTSATVYLLTFLGNAIVLPKKFPLRHFFAAAGLSAAGLGVAAGAAMGVTIGVTMGVEERVKGLGRMGCVEGGEVRTIDEGFVSRPLQTFRRKGSKILNTSCKLN